MNEELQSKSGKNPILEDVDITIPNHGSVVITQTTAPHHTGFNVGKVARLTRMLIIAGAASFVFGIILEISSLSVHCEAYCPPVWVSQVGAGLWSGMVFAGIGLFIRFALKNISICYIIAIMALTASGSLVAILEITLSIAAIVFDRNSYGINRKLPSHRYEKYGNYVNEDERYEEYIYFTNAGVLLPNLVLILSGVFVFILLVVISVFTCIASCCKKNPSYLRINIYEPVSSSPHFDAPYAQPLHGAPTYFAVPGCGGSGGAMQPIIMMPGGSQPPSAYQTFKLVPVSSESPPPSSESTTDPA